MGYNTLFVVPQNMLKQDIDCDAETLNTFFSIPVFKGDRLTRYDYSPYQVMWSQLFAWKNVYYKQNPKKKQKKLAR